MRPVHRRSRGGARVYTLAAALTVLTVAVVAAVTSVDAELADRLVQRERPDRVAAGRAVRRDGPDHRAARHGRVGGPPERRARPPAHRGLRVPRDQRDGAAPAHPREVDQDQPDDPRGGGRLPARDPLRPRRGRARGGWASTPSAIAPTSSPGAGPRWGRLGPAAPPGGSLLVLTELFERPLNRMMGAASRSRAGRIARAAGRPLLLSRPDAAARRP